MTNNRINGVYSKLQSEKGSLPQLAEMNLVMRLISTSCGSGPPLEERGIKDNSPLAACSCCSQIFGVMWKLKVHVTELFYRTWGYLT